MAPTIPQPVVDRLALDVPADLAPDGRPAYVGETGGIEAYRWGSLLMRLPTSDEAVNSIENESRWLEEATAGLARAGISAPIPRYRGSPSAAFTRPWLLVDAVDGEPLPTVPVDDRGRIARDLAVGLAALHAKAPAGAPAVASLNAMAEAFEEAVAGIPQADRLRALFARGLEADPWEGEPVWCHARLVPGSLLTAGGRLVGVGFTGIGCGDPAVDYAAFHLGFTAQQRADARVILHALGAADDEALWTRAEGWAAYRAASLVASGEPLARDYVDLLLADG